jgi:diguanylate cyclase (GGDEF)-like protein
MLRYHVQRNSGSADRDEIDRQLKWMKEHVAKLTRGKTFSYTQHLASGRIVQVTNQPLSGGGWVDIQEDITSRRKAEEKISWLAHHDPLTSTANRAYFQRELDNALRKLRPGAGFAMHAIDLDKFKEVNDQLGHPVGDALLKSVVRSLRTVVRETDLVARLGGDEFMVLQPISGVEDAERLAPRLLHAIRRPRRVLGHDLKIGASIGTVIAPDHGTTSAQLMKHADLALYSAKSAGRGTCAIFTTEPAGTSHRVSAVA